MYPSESPPLSAKTSGHASVLSRLASRFRIGLQGDRFLRLTHVFLPLLAFPLACRALGPQTLEPLWTAPLATKGTPLVANGMVFVWGFPAGHPGEPYHIYALDARTGREVGIGSWFSSPWRLSSTARALGRPNA